MSDKQKIESAFHEVFHNKPSTVKRSKSPEGQRKQMVAIALSKARQAGANIPKKHNGGDISEDGVYELKAGEKVIPAPSSVSIKYDMGSGRNNKTIDAEINEISHPSMGTKMAKTDNYEDTLRKGSLPAAETVTEAKEEPGAAKRCLDAQLGRHKWSSTRTGGNLGDATTQPQSGSCYDDGGAGVPGYQKEN